MIEQLNEQSANYVHSREEKTPFTCLKMQNWTSIWHVESQRVLTSRRSFRASIIHWSLSSVHHPSSLPAIMVLVNTSCHWPDTLITWMSARILLRRSVGIVTGRVGSSSVLLLMLVSSSPLLVLTSLSMLSLMPLLRGLMVCCVQMLIMWGKQGIRQSMWSKTTSGQHWP